MVGGVIILYGLCGPVLEYGWWRYVQSLSWLDNLKRFHDLARK
jgi:hypothetical protein